MDPSSTMTMGRWKELLEGVREEVGEGRIRGFGLNRRLEVASEVGSAELRLGGGADEDGEYYTHCICLFFRARRRFSAEVRLGRNAGPPIWRPNRWKRVRSGIIDFDAQFEAWSPKPEEAAALLSTLVRRSLIRLSDIHPGVYLYVDGRDVTLLLPGLTYGRTAILEFLLNSIGCVQHLLAGDAVVK